MKLNEREERILELTKRMVERILDTLPRFDFGHGFLWGYVTIRRAQKNGKVREFKVKTILACSTPIADWDAAQRLIEEMVPGVSGTWVNMD
jgi:hypothetical protein